MDKNIIYQIINNFLIENTQLFLVDLNISADNKIVIEIDCFSGVTIQMCEDLSRYIEKNLGKNEENYELEVGSAGLTTPFKVVNQYTKNIGKEVEVYTSDGQKLIGMLKNADQNAFTIVVEKKIKPEGAKRKIVMFEELTFDYQDIKSTKYLLKV
ncbi:MAG: ribosome assembly cofactor RimP [Paludibacter sp.]|nr:ribosome assembly cofactor RimP [Paludibacter sp.]